MVVAHFAICERFWGYTVCISVFVVGYTLFEERKIKDKMQFLVCIKKFKNLKIKKNRILCG